jgi:hypothetical protein
MTVTLIDRELREMTMEMPTPSLCRNGQIETGRFVVKTTIPKWRFKRHERPLIPSLTSGYAAAKT